MTWIRDTDLDAFDRTLSTRINLQQCIGKPVLLVYFSILVI